MKTALAAAGCVMACASAQAGIIDFESIPATYLLGEGGWTAPGALTSLTVTDTEGVVVTITRSTGTAFDIVDLSQHPRPGHWGAKALSPYADIWGSGFIVFSLSPPAGKWVERVVIEFGDYGTDQGNVKIEGATPAGQVWFHRMTHWSGNLAHEHGTLDSSAWGNNQVGTFIAMGEGWMDNSVFWDNIRLTVVPGPASGVIGVGALLVWGRGRRRAR